MTKQMYKISNRDPLRGLAGVIGIKSHIAGALDKNELSAK